VRFGGVPRYGIGQDQPSLRRNFLELSQRYLSDNQAVSPACRGGAHTG
jgi:hypothetical protein